VVPLWTTILPPDPLSVDPTRMDMVPDAPPAATPVAATTPPALPAVVEPVVKERTPLPPDTELDPDPKRTSPATATQVEWTMMGASQLWR
jgi:hypothetical protein